MLRGHRAVDPAAIERRRRLHLRADDPTGATPGLIASHSELAAPSALPDFTLRTSSASETVASNNFPSTGDAVAGSGRAATAGAAYPGRIDIPTTGFRGLSSASDDGSTLDLGTDLVADSDGLHGMVTVTGARSRRACTSFASSSSRPAAARGSPSRGPVQAYPASSCRPSGSSTVAP